MVESNDFNAGIIEEFRANAGRVGGQFEGTPLLLLHTIGARTGTHRVNPVMYRAVDGGYAVFASNAGAPDNPDWYHNLLAHPKTWVETGSETVEVVARIAQGAKREAIWTRQTADLPQFANYEASTDREIPVLVLEPVSS